MVHRRRWIMVVAVLMMSLALEARAGQDQTTSQGSPSSGQGTSTSSSKSRHTPAQDLLIRGTVFNEHALSLEGTTLRLHRAGEKKNHWQTVSNFRGEFAIRVPHDAVYEIVAEHKGYQPQTLQVGEKDAERNVVFHMVPAAGGKK
jgi:hypothetical protein